MPNDKLPRGLYALIDDSLRSEVSLEARARAAVAGGAAVIQLRLELTGDRAALDIIRAVCALARPQRVPVIVNDRVDLALVGGADGVHLGKDDLPIGEARRLLGAGALIGATARNLTDMRAAAESGADHVGLGPIFVTSTKQVDAPPLGISAFAELVRAAPLPVVGIAGITLESIGLVARAGARAAAVAGDLLRGGDLVSRARALREAFFVAQP